ncbi:ROK family protein [Paenibacillus sp. N1-5-1-14]|uniref:ROK family protein n=1 Tax=Paenibacillus radicibacter TaxID=2972488 RepID=UPI0021591314|nr:ROK family protein [Paenibacillus radicibacter]MCR8642516.1 ROK family protein [Paenibacillus radicibacter]
MEYAVGIDIGGTKTAIGIVSVEGQVVTKQVLPTDLTISPAMMIDRICDTVQQMMKDSGLAPESFSGIGIGAPGPLDTSKGMIACPPNLPEWVDIPVVEMFQAKFDMPIRMENDATAGALAEKWKGAAQANENFIYLTISTGIGAGIYVDGKLATGARGNAGDVGHMIIDPSYGTCVCGQKGCFEYIASGTGIARKGSELMGEDLTTKQIFQLYEDKHPVIEPFIHDIYTYIGMGCVSLINLFDPEKIVIGGGVSQVGESLFQGVQQYVQQFALNTAGRKTEIVPASLNQDAGLIGAAALILSTPRGVTKS